MTFASVVCREIIGRKPIRIGTEHRNERNTQIEGLSWELFGPLGNGINIRITRPPTKPEKWRGQNLV